MIDVQLHLRERQQAVAIYCVQVSPTLAADLTSQWATWADPG